MAKLDLIGATFSRLTVLSEHGRDRRGNVVWLCVCVCGEKTTATSGSLSYGNKKSCGCLQRHKASQHTRKFFPKRSCASTAVTRNLPGGSIEDLDDMVKW